MAEHVARKLGDVLRDDVAAAPDQGEGTRCVDEADRAAGAGAEPDVLGEGGLAVAGGLTGGTHDRDRVGDDRRVHVDARGRGLELGETGGVQDGPHLGGRAQRALDDRGLLGGRGVADHDLHQEPVHLRLGQRVGALGLDGVLGGHHEERARDPVALLPDRDLALLHDLEQGGLDLGRGAVDLVGEEEVAEHRTELGVERAGVRTVDPRAHEVAGDEVRGELDASERGVQGVRQRPDRQGLGQARHALEQEVAAGEERDQDALEHLVLAHDHAADLEQDRLGGGAGIGERVDRRDGRARPTGEVGHETSCARGPGLVVSFGNRAAPSGGAVELSGE